jgi:glyoxylase-like metal-dependent hydrolase (beta-lactamase superfamily II)
VEPGDRNMQKTTYGNVIRYTFGPETIPRVGHNIYAVKSEESLTIIDPSSENMVGEIKKDDDFNADRLKNVIISHYHGDHIGGIAQLPKCTIWGSEQYAKTLGDRYPQSMIDLVKPSVDLKYGVQYTLGGVPARFYQGRGHTACGILTVIGEEFIHTNDIVGFNERGDPILPLIFDSAYEYYRTIQKILGFNLKIIIPHMQNLDQTKIRDTLLIYKEYLEEILEHREQFDLKKFEEKQGISFDYSMHHSKNLRHLGI